MLAQGRASFLFIGLQKKELNVEEYKTQLVLLGDLAGSVMGEERWLNLVKTGYDSLKPISAYDPPGNKLISLVSVEWYAGYDLVSQRGRVTCSLSLSYAGTVLEAIKNGVGSIDSAFKAINSILVQ